MAPRGRVLAGCTTTEPVFFFLDVMRADLLFNFVFVVIAGRLGVTLGAGTTIGLLVAPFTTGAFSVLVGGGAQLKKKI